MLKKGSFLLLLFISNAIGAFDNLHFYQANRFWGEPRFERPWLGSFEVTVGGGSALNSRNSLGNLTGLFNIYGPHNLQHLAQGVPNLNPANHHDALLLELNALPNNGCFGNVLFGGSISLHEAIFDVRQNFDHGLFFAANLPIRSFHVQPTLVCDLSPTTGFPNAQHSSWRTLLLHLDEFMEHYGLSLAGYKKRGFGDLSIAAGWARNYQDTTHLDFIDGTIMCGVICPTSRPVRIERVFDLPTGYNGHWGMATFGWGALGLWEWLTIGASAGGIFLIDKDQCAGIKSGCAQNGWIKLAQTPVTVSPGVRWEASGYVKADHLNEFFSFLLGYSYNRKEQDYLYGLSTHEFSRAIVNSDGALKPFDMHTLHVMFELDFAQEGRLVHPRVYFFYDHPVAGHRIFQLSVGGATFGVDLTW